MSQTRELTVWAQWDDLVVPSGFTLRSPANTDLASASEAELSDISFYVPSYMGGRTALEYSRKMPNLKVLQMPNAGYEDAIEFTRPGMTLCNGRGIHDASTAELAVGLAIASLRGFPEFVRNQDKGQWVHSRQQSINDKKVAIIGYGSIGKTVARNLSGFDVTVVPFSRSGNDGALKIAELDTHLPTFDVVILILPLNDESRKMFNKERLALLKDGALLVNVARGSVVDESALIEALQQGTIAGAGLDVFAQEPRVPEALWHLSNVVLTPHMASATTETRQAMADLAFANMQAGLSGQPLLTPVPECMAKSGH
mgnify:CR=1 FL=1